MIDYSGLNYSALCFAFKTDRRSSCLLRENIKLLEWEWRSGTSWALEVSLFSVLANLCHWKQIWDNGICRVGRPSCAHGPSCSFLLQHCEGSLLHLEENSLYISSVGSNWDVQMGEGALWGWKCSFPYSPATQGSSPPESIHQSRSEDCQ